MAVELPDNWEVATLEDRMEAIIDYRGKTPRKTTVGIPLITAKVVKGGRIETPDEFIDPAEYDEWMRRGLPRKGDVLLTTEAPLGEVAQLGDAKVALAQRLIALRGRPNSLDNTFLKFLLQSEAIQMQLAARSSGSTVAGIKQSELRKVRLILPPFEEQQAIACILGSLDDKIELTRRMNRTLEGMARAIFKSWFVDFDPVRAKAAGQPRLTPALAKLFPDCFEDSELGEIPKGWKVTQLGAAVKRVAMGPFGSSIKTDNFVPAGVPVIRGGNLTNGFVDENFVYLTESKADELRNANAYPLDIVITHRGTLGQIGLIPKEPSFPRYVVSQSQMLIRTNEQLPARYLYLYLTSPSGQQALLANTSQTGVPAIAQPTSSVKALKIVQPCADILARFERIIASSFSKMELHRKESRTLAALRDALLPKLISGQIRVPDAERIVGSVD